MELRRAGVSPLWKSNKLARKEKSVATSSVSLSASNPRLTATLHVRRLKQGTPSTHPIVGDELRALRRLQREQEPKSPFVFTSERGASFTTAGFARMIERAGVEGKFGFKVHPHMLRHACGYWCRASRIQTTMQIGNCRWFRAPATNTSEVGGRRRRYG
jgi:integrase